MLKNREECLIITYCGEDKIRLKNLHFVLDYYSKIYQNQIVLVCDKTPINIPKKIITLEIESKSISQMVNYAVNLLQPQYFIKCDADTIIDVDAFKQCRKLMGENIQWVIPFSGRFFNIKKNNIQKSIQLTIKHKKIYPNMYSLLHQENAKGGIWYWNKECFVKYGMINQKFVGYGYQDREIYDRCVKLGVKFKRLNYNLIHFDHPRLNTRQIKQLNRNRIIYLKQLNKSSIDLLDEIKTWQWVKSN